MLKIELIRFEADDIITQSVANSPDQIGAGNSSNQGTGTGAPGSGNLPVVGPVAGGAGGGPAGNT